MYLLDAWNYLFLYKRTAFNNAKKQRCTFSNPKGQSASIPPNKLAPDLLTKLCLQGFFKNDCKPSKKSPSKNN